MIQFDLNNPPFNVASFHQGKIRFYARGQISIYIRFERNGMKSRPHTLCLRLNHHLVVAFVNTGRRNLVVPLVVNENPCHASRPPQGPACNLDGHELWIVSRSNCTYSFSLEKAGLVDRSPDTFEGY